MIAKSIAASLLIIALLSGCVSVDCEEEQRGGVSVGGVSIGRRCPRP